MSSSSSPISPWAGGVILLVHIQPGAKKSEVIGVLGGRIKIRIAAPPVDGKANAALVEFLTGLFGVSRHQLEVVRGHASRQKTVLISGLSEADVKGLIRLV